MRKAVVLHACIILLMLVIPAAFAASAGIYVNLTSSSPTIPDHGGHYYQECLLTVGGTGSHDFTYSNITGMPTNQPIALIYPQGGFNPASWGTNLIGFTQGGAFNLSAGTYTVAFSTNTGGVGNGGVLFTGSYTATVTGPGSVSSDCPSASPSVVVVVPNDDFDGDGISNDRDNCPYDKNPDQEDGWGSGMGDLCDVDWYNMTGIALAGFEQKNGEYHLHGNCTYMADGDPRCPEIAVFDPAAFTPDSMPMEVTSEYAGAMSVWIYYLHSNNGADVYQVNVYTTNPPQPDTLLDDRLEIHVSGGTWTWIQRGGNGTGSNGSSFGG